MNKYDRVKLQIYTTHQKDTPENCIYLVISEE